MKTCEVYLNVPKKRKSSKTTENGAILEALNTSPLEWKRDVGTGIENLQALQQLKDAMSEVKIVLRENPHVSMALLHDMGAFSLFQVQSHRGYWRVSLTVELEEKRPARMVDPEFQILKRPRS